jgi:hypothetical protein
LIFEEERRTMNALKYGVVILVAVTALTLNFGDDGTAIAQGEGFGGSDGIGDMGPGSNEGGSLGGSDGGDGGSSSSMGFGISVDFGSTIGVSIDQNAVAQAMTEGLGFTDPAGSPSMSQGTVTSMSITMQDELNGLVALSSLAAPPDAPSTALAAKPGSVQMAGSFAVGNRGFGFGIVPDIESARATMNAINTGLTGPVGIIDVNTGAVVGTKK